MYNLFLCLILFILQFTNTLQKEPSITIEDLNEPENCYPQAQDGDTVIVHYVGKLANGQIFDSSMERDSPLSVKLGTGGVIPGFEQGLRGLCANKIRRVTIPPELAYGDKGVPPTIPPKSTLIFELECRGVERPSLGRDLIPFLQTISPGLIFLVLVYYFYNKFKEIPDKEWTKKSQKKEEKRKQKTK